MKKLMTLVLLIALMISSSGTDVRAEDADVNADTNGGCEVLPAPNNIRTSGNWLYWDTVPGADHYEVLAYAGDSSTPVTQVPERNEINMTKHPGVTDVGTYSFEVYAISPDDSSCNSLTPAKVSNVTIRRMTIKVTTDGKNSTEGGTAESSFGDNELVADQKMIMVYPTRGYGFDIYASSQEERVMHYDSEGVISYSIPVVGLDRFADNVIYIDFKKQEDVPVVSSSLLMKIDFGNHKDLISGVKEKIDATSNPSNIVETSVSGSVLSIQITEPTDMYDNFTVSTMLQKAHSLIMYALDDGEIGVDTPIYDNELLIMTSTHSSISSYKTILDDLSDFERKPEDVGNKCYLIWEKYESNGDKNWNLGDSGGVTFTFKRNFDDKGYTMPADYYGPGQEAREVFKSTYDCFLKVEVDGEELSADDYKIVKGSLKLTLKDSYLNGLDEGEHEVKVYLDSGYVLQQHSALYQATLTSTAKLTVSKGNGNSKPDENTSQQHFTVPNTGVE